MIINLYNPSDNVNLDLSFISDDWKSYENFCASSTNQDLPQTNHKIGDAGIMVCKEECRKNPKCSAIEWYNSGWGGSKCKVMIGNIQATQGSLGGRWQDAECYVKPGKYRDFQLIFSK